MLQQICFAFLYLSSLCLELQFSAWCGLGVGLKKVKASLMKHLSFPNKYNSSFSLKQTIIKHYFRLNSIFWIITYLIEHLNLFSWLFLFS